MLKSRPLSKRKLRKAADDTRAPHLLPTLPDPESAVYHA